MTHLILTSLYFFLPAYVANMAPVAAAHLKWPGGPLSVKWFGPHKTYRAFYGGIIGALLIVYMQYAFETAGWLGSVRSIDYTTLNVLPLAVAFGFGTIAGDTFKSFCKRRFGIASGRPWVPFDQIDFILGAAACVALVTPFPLSIFIAALILTPVLHLVVNVFAYLTGIKKVWW